MLRTILAGALASGALLAGGGAHAQGFGVGAGVGVGYGYGGGYGGYYGGAPAYAAGGYGYAPYHREGFTLAGVRAGVTVLGVDIDGSAKLTIGAHDWNRGGYAPPPAPYYPPAPQPYPEPYPQPVVYPQQQTYVMPSYGCGCAPPPQPCCQSGGPYLGGYGGY